MARFGSNRDSRAYEAMHEQRQLNTLNIIDRNTQPHEGHRLAEGGYGWVCVYVTCVKLLRLRSVLAARQCPALEQPNFNQNMPIPAWECGPR